MSRSCGPTGRAPIITSRFEALVSEQAHGETWREWVGDAGDPPELSRVEVLARIESLGLRFDLRTLRYWTTLGVLPRPTTLGKSGTAGSYPEWIIDLIFQARRLQTSGLSLEQIRPRMRFEAVQLAGHYRNRPEGVEELGPRRSWPPEDLRRPARGILMATPLEPQGADLLAQLVEALAGSPVTAITLTVQTADGQSFAVPVRRLAEMAEEH